MILWRSGLFQIGISHFNHNKDFIYEARGFQTVEEMNVEIIKRHNEVVAPEDTVYVLGDLCMGTEIERNKQLIESLNGNLKIILGNHDSENRIKMYAECANVIKVCGYATMLKYRKYNFYLSHFASLTDNYTDGKSLKTKMPCICGHTHTTNFATDMDKGLIFHCEVDTNNCYPWNIDDIIEKLKGVV